MAKTRKNQTRTMDELEQRISGMKAIKETLDLDNGVSVAQGEALLGDARATLAGYNAKLAEADDLLNTFNDQESLLRAFNKKVLPAVGLKYGTDSSEYEKVGGVRESERKKPLRKLKTPTP